MQAVHPGITVLSNKLAPRLGLGPTGATILISWVMTTVAPMWERVYTPAWLLDVHEHWLLRALVTLALLAYAVVWYRRKLRVRKSDGTVITKVVIHLPHKTTVMTRAIQGGVVVRGISFDVPPSVDKGYYDARGRLFSGLRLTSGYTVRFFSKTQKFHGEITVQEKDVEYDKSDTDDTKQKQTHTHMAVTLRAPVTLQLTANALVDELIEAYDESLAKETTRKLYCIECMHGKDSVETSMGTFSTDRLEELERTYVRSFVSKHLDAIWTRVQRVCLKPEDYTSRCQPASVRYLLHGPPGTGKSSLPYRMARATGRHLVIVHLTSYLSDMWALMDLVIGLRTDRGNYSAKEVVIVFEEFDEAVRVLRDREAKEARDALSDVTRERPLAPDAAGTSNRVTLKGLLTLMQGPMPVEGQVLFANTNDVDLIREALPALLRRGRMNVVHMGHWSWDELVQYTRATYPDGDGLAELTPFKIDIPPSEVVDMAMDRDYTGFVEALRECLTATGDGGGK